MVKCMTIEFKTTDMSIFKDMINVMKEVIEDKRISEDIRDYYENKIHSMVECFEREHINIYQKVPKECYEEFGQDLDGCSTQENEGCGRCSLYK